MSLKLCTLTGVDEATPLIELAVLSDMYPHVEWGFLYSAKRGGGIGRYPSVERIGRAFKELPSYVKVSLHLSGAGTAHLIDGEEVVLGLFNQLRAREGRMQLNFDASEGGVDLAKLGRLLQNYPGVTFITQRNDANAGVLEALSAHPNHAVLFDASLGRGIVPPSWPGAIKSVACGYAGGLGPDTLEQQLPRIFEAAGGADFWIDMESKVRDADDRFDMHAARRCLDLVGSEVARRLHVPGQRPRRRQCELSDLLDRGLFREGEGDKDVEMMLRRMVNATSDVSDPRVTSVRQHAVELLRKRGTAGALREEAGDSLAAMRPPERP